MGLYVKLTWGIKVLQPFMFSFERRVIKHKLILTGENFAVKLEPGLSLWWKVGYAATYSLCFFLMSKTSTKKNFKRLKVDTWHSFACNFPERRSNVWIIFEFSLSLNWSGWGSWFIPVQMSFKQTYPVHSAQGLKENP